MSSNFWKNLPKPFFILAPMAGVTDVVFREMISGRGRPDVFYTEFVSVDGLLSRGRDHLMVDLKFTESQRPIVAQIFGSDPEKFRIVAGQLAEMGFDGIDINMGCPDKNVEKQGGGASLIKDVERAKAIIAATVEGARSTSRGDSMEPSSRRAIPIAVKTRIGYNAVDLEWIRALLETEITTLIVHLRTRREMSLVPAHWELMPEIAKMAHVAGKIIVGNGDVRDRAHGEQLAAETGCDGIMIGRGIFADHWLFNEKKQQNDLSTEERLLAMVEHTRSFEKALPMKHFALMKKHFKVYTLGLPDATTLREELMTTESADEVEKIVQRYLAQ